MVDAGDDLLGRPVNAYQRYERRERWRNIRGQAIGIALVIAAFVALSALVLH